MDRLFYKYLAPLLAISIIPVLVSGVLLYILLDSNFNQLQDNLADEVSVTLQTEISQKNEAIAQNKGMYVEAQVERIGNKLNAMVLSPDFINLNLNEIAIHATNIMSQEEPIINFTVVNKWGREVFEKQGASSLTSEALEDISEGDLFTTLSARKSYISDIEMSSSQRPYVTFAQPILSITGNLEGGAIINIDLGFLADVMSTERIGKEGIVYIISRTGQLIAHHSPKEINQNMDYSKYEYIQEILKQKVGTIPRDGSIVSFYTNSYNWVTIIELPVEQALASVDDNRETIQVFINNTTRSISLMVLAVIVLILLIAVASSVFITRRIITPIIELTEATKRVSEGELNVELVNKSGDEIGQLTDSFGKMTRELRKQQDELIKSNEYVKQQAEELLDRYNSDLEQFAYVTTHDLIEPLRMITSYVQLLQRRYAEIYDDDAKEFMGFIIEGVERMHGIINDLFEYSHIRTNVTDFEDVDCRKVFDSVLDKLDKQINESGAVITCEGLPVTKAVESNIGQLFQNFIGNSIKFKSDRPLKIVVKAEDRGDEWAFSFSDNGIGFDSKYKDKIFEIFKRLNKRDAYPGSGMGLAICKNIVERHGGKIWAESEPGKGTTISFTIKKYD